MGVGRVERQRPIAIPTKTVVLNLIQDPFVYVEVLHLS